MRVRELLLVLWRLKLAIGETTADQVNQQVGIAMHATSPKLIGITQCLRRNALSKTVELVEQDLVVIAVDMDRAGRVLLILKVVHQPQEQFTGGTHIDDVENQGA